MEICRDYDSDLSSLREVKLVAFGGGSGLSTLLRGVKSQVRATAIVAMSDDGGGTGKMREDGFLAYGDLRKCLVALASPGNTWADIFELRFSSGTTLANQNAGNLLLGCKDDKSDPLGSLAYYEQLLQTEGHVLPSTLDNPDLEAILKDGRRVVGETNIAHSKGSSIMRVGLRPTATACPQAIDAIRTAQVMTFGPGSLFSSVCSSLLPRGMVEAIRASSAKRIMILNLASDPETRGYDAIDHIRTIEEILGRNQIDVILADDRRPKRDDGLEPQTWPLLSNLTDKRIILRPIRSSEDSTKHDPDALARAVLYVASSPGFLVQRKPA